MTPDHFDFSHALTLLKAGKRVAREAWNEWGEVAWLEVMRDSAGQPYVSARDAAKCDFTWRAAQADMFADDWHEVTG